MSAQRPANEGPGGTPGWADFDADLLDTPGLGNGRAPDEAPSSLAGPLSAADSGFDFGNESQGDLDLAATFAGDGFPRPPGGAHSRRAHALSAAGAGLAVVLALAIHAATEGVFVRRAPAGTTTFAHVARTPQSHRPSPTTSFPMRAGAPRRRASSTARPTAARASDHTASAARVVIASSPRVSRPAQPSAEFGFER